MTVPQPYNQFHDDEPEMARVDRSGWKRYGALVCGVLQISLATHMIGIGVMKDALNVLMWGAHAFLGGTLSILAGAFAIQYSRSGMKCPTIAALVLSVVTTLVMVSALMANCVVINMEVHVEHQLEDLIASNKIRQDADHDLRVAELVLEHTIGYAAEVSAGAMIFACSANLIVSILQIVLASSMVCKRRNTTNNYNINTHMANNPIPHAASVQYGTRTGDDVIMTQMSSNA